MKFIGRLHHLFVSLLVTGSANATILSVHCPLGCPESPTDNDLIFNHIYALSNNPVTKFADWVAYEVNPVNYGVTPGRDWNNEPLLDASETLEEADYKGANKSSLGSRSRPSSALGVICWFSLLV